MNNLGLIDFFDQKKIYRDGLFKNTYAVNRGLEKSIGYATNRKIIKRINNDRSVSSVIVNSSLKDYVSNDKAVVISENPKKDFFAIHNEMVKRNHFGQLQKNEIHESVKIASDAIIKKGVIIEENVQIGNLCLIESNTRIGKNTTIEACAKIGVKGMQNTYIDGEIYQVKYAGGVKIGSNSRILSGSIIQKPYQFFDTEIGNNTIISVDVTVGHGCEIGDRTMISGKTGIGGNTKIGNGVWIGGGAGISDGIVIGDNAKVKLKSVVIEDVGEHKTVSGHFAISHHKNLKEHLRKK